MIINANLVLSVLLVTSCCCGLAVGGAEVLRRVNNGNDGSSDDADGMSQINKTVDALMLAEVNGVASSTTESQGASDTAEVHRSRSLSIAATKEAATANDDGAMDTSNVKSQEKEKDIPLSSSLSSMTSTTARTIRNGASSSRSSTSRDNKLMTLLAARRSALQHSHVTGTRRRTAAPNRTLLELPSSASSLSSSKNPNDPRTSCEKNCTKNFTRRTTASCIRRCLALQKSLNSTATSTVRTKVDEKDNNEILETDESSHGFFVIAKDVNDTVNHIGDGGKSSEASTEKINRGAQKSSVSLDAVDIPPYLYFGQKLPPLKPSHKLNQTGDGTVKQSPDRTRNWRRNQPTRNFGSYRFHNSRNVIRPTTTPIVITPTAELANEQLPEKVAKADDSLKLKGEFFDDEPKGSNATETILIRSSSETPHLASTESKTDAIVIRANIATVPTGAVFLNSTISSSTPFQSYTISHSTTLTSLSTLATTPINIVSHPFTSETPATPKPSATQVATTNPVITGFTTLDATTPSFTGQPETKAMETTLPPLPPEELAKVLGEVSEDKPNLIIFYNITTRQPTPPAPSVFTRTTISSSVRSTVNPKVRLPAETTSAVEYNLSSVSIESSTVSVESSSGGSVIYNSFTPALQDVEAVTMVNGEVTIEVTRAHITTYVLAGLGMIPIIIIILYVTKTIILKRRYKDDDDLDQFTSDGKPISPIHKMDHSEEDSNDQYSIVTERDFERSNLRFKSLLGEGNFGQVWKAEADDLVGYMGTTRIVAVKTVRSGGTQVSLREEAEIMRKLGSHPNVVTLLGTCLETEPHLLIMEYAMRGRLLSLLRAARSATNILPASVPGGRSLAPLSPRTLSGFALDIARGMEYISEKKIVHRDLAARNVLLDHNGVCKICDFGMSLDLEQSQNSPVQSKKSDSLQQTQCFDTRFHFDFGGRWMNHWNNINNSHDKKHDSVSKRPALPIRWMAPEALQYHIFSIKTDVWAFGIVLWEIATLGCTPYPNLSGREVIRNVPNGARPELPHDGRPEFYELMQRCWRKDPPSRPSFREARIEISRISCKWHDDDLATSDYMDVSGFSEDLEHGMVYFNRRISEFECEI